MIANAALLTAITTFLIVGWLAGELSGGGVGQVLSLAAYRHRQQARDDRSDDEREQPEHQNHQRTS